MKKQEHDIRKYSRIIGEVYRKAKKVKGITAKEYEKRLRVRKIPADFIKTEMLMAHIPAIIRSKRIKKGLSVNQLTKRSKVNISRLENALSLKHYGLKALIKVCWAMNLKLHLLFKPI